jgi:phosphoribosyl-ATP pyrophosphohydrolase/phosphoribosyl-AMP cyclohydrolase/histidinol dehydrogenase
METTIPLPFVPQVDFAQATLFSEGLTRDQLVSLGCVYVSPKDADVNKLLDFLQQHVSMQTLVNVSAISSLEDIVSILDAGARTVFVQSSQLAELGAYSDRIALVYSHDAMVLGQTATGGILVESEDDIESYKAILQKLKDAKVSPIFLLSSSKDGPKACVDVAGEHLAIPVLRTTNLTMDNTSTESQLSVPSIIATSWTTDRPDKLMPTIVTDERGISLGLVYSSQESLAESFKTGTGVYQSRKRGLWYKGATSGDTQELVKISLDCDQDCLKFVVKQKGRGKFRISLCCDNV